MKRPFVKNLRVREVGCLKDVDVSFTRFHALIGPNDSGKSTVLRTLESLFAFAANNSDGSSQNPLIGEWKEGRSVECTISTENGLHRYGYDIPEGKKNLRGEYFVECFTPENRTGPCEIVRRWREPNISRNREGKYGSEWTDVLGPFFDGSAWLLRFDPDLLKQPSELIPEGKENSFFDERGRGLPGVLDLVFNRGDDSREKLQARIRELFPTVKNIGLRNVSNSQKELQVELTDGTRVGAKALSEGLLYFLAFAVLQYMDSPSLLLVEEPENGLHPARVADVVRVLKEISLETQVIMATHSPLVINEMKPEEVTLVIREREEGSKVIPVKQTRNFEDRFRIYELGELWLSYADGDREILLHEEESDEDESGKPENEDTGK